MTLTEAIENTMLSSCFIESTDGSLCFHYYKHNFFLNNGNTIELMDDDLFERFAKKEYAIKYGIDEINYEVLKTLHEKLENGEFNKEIDSFLSVYDPDNIGTAYNLIKEKIRDKEDVDMLYNIKFEDVGFSAFVIKYFLTTYKSESKLNSFMFGISFIMNFITSHMVLNMGFNNYSFLIIILSYILCTINDTYEYGITLNSIIQFIYSFGTGLLMNLFIFNHGHYIIGTVITLLLLYNYMGFMSHKGKTIKRAIKMFDLEVFK